MARTFYRFARSSLPAATTALAASTTFADDKKDDGRVDRFHHHGGGVSSNLSPGWPFSSSGAPPPPPTTTRVCAFSHRPHATLCEVPHQHPSWDKNAAYRPSDPAEPAAGGVDADGRGKGRAEGGGMGMWGEERDGSVSPPYSFVLVI